MIALIPWVQGSRDPWKGDGYTAARIRWTVEQCVKAMPDVPVFVATPHVDADVGMARIIGCAGMMQRYRLSGCGVMTAAYHPALAHLDILSITADTAVLRDVRKHFVAGEWCCPQQHLPKARPYGDWIVRLPPQHPIRAAIYKTFTTYPDRAAKFDMHALLTARAARLEPRLVKPPVILNGEWIAEGWAPWCQPLTEETVAIHPHSSQKWPEFAAAHPYFSVLPPMFDRPVTDEMRHTQQAAHATVEVPSTLS